MKYAAIMFATFVTSNVHLHAAEGMPNKKSYAQALVATTYASRRSAISVIEPKDQLMTEQQNLRTIQIMLRKKRKALRKIKSQIDELTNNETATESRIAKLAQAEAFKQLIELRQKKEQLQTNAQQELARLEGAIAQLASNVSVESLEPTNHSKQSTQEKEPQPDAEPKEQQQKLDAPAKQDSTNKSWLSWPFGS